MLDRSAIGSRRSIKPLATCPSGGWARMTAPMPQPIPQPIPQDLSLPNPIPALRGMQVLQRGWLSSNNVLLRGEGEGAWLIDSGHVRHAGQTVALLRHALAGEPLAGLFNTHLHSDHCGGNAAVRRELGGHIRIPAGSWDAASRWDESALSYADTGQRCEPFRPDSSIASGSTLAVGRRRWQVLAAPGHDPDSVMLFDAEQGVLISADALWENGYGVVFPELDGAGGFDEVAMVLDLIQRLDARCVIPGHGAPFADVAAALQRARRRLAGQRADPARHARHAAKVLVKYHLMEVAQQPWPVFIGWFCGTPLCQRLWLRLGRPENSLAAFGEKMVHELRDGGALALRDGVLHDIG